MSRNLKLLVVALDGFDPDLFVGWRDRLPYLRGLVERGAFSPLCSTIPPMTFPAWSTFLTGVNPGTHGILDFTKRIPDKLGVRFVNAGDRIKPGFLRILSDHGIPVGSVGIPTTFPPEPVDGFQISGFDTPLPSKADGRYMYPQELSAVIEKELGGYYFGNFNESRVSAGWHKRTLTMLFDGLERKQALCRVLHDHYPVELFVLHVGETDTVGHHYWSYHDERSPRHMESDDSSLTSAILQMYQKADELVGAVTDLMQPENVIIVSDHGMGGTSDRMLYLNAFLAQHGFLHFGRRNRSSELIGAAKRFGMKWMPYRWQQLIFHLASGKIVNNIESIQRFGSIDWERTQAYSEELNYFPAIWLNRKDREPLGIVDSDDEDRVVEELRNALDAWIDPLSGDKIVQRVFRKEEIYQGAATADAPDLILEFNKPEGYRYALGRSTTSRTAAFRQMEPDEYLGYKGGTMNGSHRQYGTLIMAGEQVIRSEVISPHLMDLAPTILKVFNLPVPHWMEGHSLLGEADITKHVNEDDISSIASHYTQREEQDIRQRLVNLGYLD